MKQTTKLWIILAVLAVITPLGLIIPNHFKAGDAWGEWRPDTIKQMSGYTPKGLEKLSSIWKAPLPDYAFKGREVKGLQKLSLAYIFSAISGMALCIVAGFLIGKMISRKETEAKANKPH
jgi:cobalt/nickel transport protein